jgi:hypothetical protein
MVRERTREMRGRQSRFSTARFAYPQVASRVSHSAAARLFVIWCLCRVRNCHSLRVLSVIESPFCRLSFRTAPIRFTEGAVARSGTIVGRATRHLVLEPRQVAACMVLDHNCLREALNAVAV